MAAKHKPIPALYTVYILRSTIRHASFYIGSTPNPPRRLSQHNGLIPGGAARTSRKDLRPWEMVALVSGFPSMTAALKFEWALNNPHISVHIPTSSRLAVSTRTKSNGQPMRPPKSMASVVSNLHLLLRVPSFVRWPLRVHFFNRQVFAAWEKWCATASERLRSSLRVVTDFGVERGAALVNGEEEKTAAPRPVDGLPLDYEPIKELVAKGQQIFEFERQGRCVICQEDMQPGEGLQAVCTNGVCDGVGHLSCWSRSMLEEDEPDNILPVQGKCPKCEGVVHWGDMMKELTLRVRGRKEVDKLLKQKRKRAEKNATKP